jgi:hypothetical protein
MLDPTPGVAEAIRARWGSEEELRRAANAGDQEAQAWLAYPGAMAVAYDAQPESAATVLTQKPLPSSSIGEAIRQSPQGQAALAVALEERAVRKQTAQTTLGKVFAEAVPASSSESERAPAAPAR